MRYLQLLLLLLTTLSSSALLAQGKPDAVRLKPGQDINSIVQSQPAGTTFVFTAGLYRTQSIVPRENDVFQAEGKAILDGAELLKPKPDHAVWTASAIRKAGGNHCTLDHPLCWYLNDLFLDDVLQVPVNDPAKLGPGKWFYDEKAGKVVLPADPTGHTVELSRTPYAFSGTATGVRIGGLTIEKYATPPQQGAIGSGSNPQGWEVSNVEVMWNHGAGIVLGAHAHIEECYIHHNGQMGLGAHGADDVVERNEIAYNNYAGYKSGWEAGGSKFSRTSNLILRSNFAHDNAGAGLWSDIDNIHVLYEGNLLVDNAGPGIEHEISFDAIIRNNILRGNKTAILIAESSNVEVYANTVAVPSHEQGIMIRHMEHRGTGVYGQWLAHDIHVFKNITVFLDEDGVTGLGTEGLNAKDEAGITGTGKADPSASAAKTLFNENTYYVPNGGDHHWTWNGPITIAAMQVLGQEQQSTVEHTVPPLPALSAVGIPSHP